MATKVLSNEFMQKIMNEEAWKEHTIGNILHGETKNIVDELTVYCDSKRLETKGARKIGFCL